MKRADGVPIDFRSLRYAPITEAAVIFLFGMVAHELGFLVEWIQRYCPDCSGERRNGSGSWESVRIEFEVKSLSFKHHKHKSVDCDVIVCWKDNWPESDRPPNLEVIELCKIIKKLPGSATYAQATS
jgi:hypothetical protein